MGYLTDNDYGGLEGDAQLSFSITEGTTYYVQAGAYDSYSTTSTTGSYTLTASCMPYVSNDSIGGTTDTAMPLTFYADAASYDSAIDEAGDVDLFRVDAAGDGTLRVEVTVPSYSYLQAQISVYDAAMNLLNSSTPSTAVTSALVRAEAGTVYYVSVAYGYASLYGDETGSYSLRVTLDPPLPADDVPGEFINAVTLELPADGSIRYESRIDALRDEDVFQFVAPLDGEYRVQQVATNGSALDSVVIAYDSYQVELTRDDDSGELGSDALLTIYGTQGSTYYIKAGSYQPLDGGASTGEYAILVERVATTSSAPGDDDFAGTRDYARDLPLEPNQQLTINGRIGHAYDLDYFRITAPATGRTTILLERGDQGSLDPELLVQTGDGDPLAMNDNAGETTSNCEVTIELEAGETYYVIAAASLLAQPEAATGSYSLSIFPPGAAVSRLEDEDVAPDAPVP
jgi:hypothetical protein